MLTKSVLGSLGLYYFSLFKAPMKVIDALESIRSKFFWGSKDGGRKIAWIAWQKVLATINKGGLSIGSLKAHNLGLLMRWWWRFKTEEGSLWREVIRSLHGVNRGLNSISSTGNFRACGETSSSRKLILKR